MFKIIRRLVAKFWPVKVVGSDQYGWCAKFPWDMNYVVSFTRKLAIEECRKRFMESKN